MKRFLEKMTCRSKEENGRTKSAEDRKIEKAARTPKSPRGGDWQEENQTYSKQPRLQEVFFEKFLLKDKEFLYPKIQ